MWSFFSREWHTRKLDITFSQSEVILIFKFIKHQIWLCLCLTFIFCLYFFCKIYFVVNFHCNILFLKLLRDKIEFLLALFFLNTELCMYFVFVTIRSVKSKNLITIQFSNSDFTTTFLIVIFSFFYSVVDWIEIIFQFKQTYN